jgi:probable phosphoglycerate mutase
MEQRIQGWLDSALTPEGAAKMEQMPLPKLNNPVLFSSDLGRALESATIISHRTGLNIHIDPRLKERGLGILEGEIIEQGVHPASHWYRYHQRYNQKLLNHYGAESEALLESRILSFLAEVQQQYDDSDVVIVSHGECLRAMRNLVQRVPSWHRGDGVFANGDAQIVKLKRNAFK